jgi:hypothetical protein
MVLCSQLTYVRMYSVFCTEYLVLFLPALLSANLRVSNVSGRKTEFQVSKFKIRELGSLG